MNYRNGATVERDGTWQKLDVELDQQDLVDLAAEHGFDFTKLSVFDRFKFARAAVTQLVVADMLARRLVDASVGGRQLAQARNELDECVRRGRGEEVA